MPSNHQRRAKRHEPSRRDATPSRAPHAFTMNATTRNPHKPHRPAFTLVEVLVVVIIIGILSAIAIPATMRAIERARETETKMEITGLADAVEQYHQKYGDFPPDGSSWQVLQRHMRKLFPRMSPVDQRLMFALTHPDGTNFSAVAMDRGEALVFFLGGFSDDVSRPLTGPGGPLEFKDYLGDGDQTALANYQYNGTRDNAFFDFEPERLAFGLNGNRYVSTDEADFGYPLNPSDPRGGQDLLPAYRSTRAKTPIVYFDSRTYGKISVTDYNGYWTNNEFGGVRPYKTAINAQPPDGSSYGSVPAAFNAVKFHNPNTFQIISPGGDGIYGAMVSVDPSNPAAQPVHFVTDSANVFEAGDAVTPDASASSLTGLKFQAGGRPVTGYQDQDWLPTISITSQLDNVTNFSDSTLGAAL